MRKILQRLIWAETLEHPSEDWWQQDLHQGPSASEDWKKPTPDIFLHISLSRIRVRSSSFIRTSYCNIDRELCLGLPPLASPRLASGSLVTRSLAKSSGCLVHCPANFNLLLLTLSHSFSSARIRHCCWPYPSMEHPAPYATFWRISNPNFSPWAGCLCHCPGFRAILTSSNEKSLQSMNN